MSGTYQELDLDNLGAKATEDDDLIIVEETEETQEAEVSVAPTPAPAPAPTAEDDDDDDGDDEAAPTTKRPLTRTQRLKAARDQWKTRASETEAELLKARERLAKLEGDAVEGAAVSMDLYIRSLDDKAAALRAEYDKAFDSGDRDALFKVSQTMAEIQAEKKLAERERRTIPMKAAPAVGSEGSQQTRPTTATTPRPSSQSSGEQPRATPEALAWHQQNQWFGKDKVLTATAYGIDAEMVEDGFDARQPGYFEELDKRLRAAMPHKFAGQEPAKPRAAGPPTVQSRGSVAPTGGKMTVKVTAADRQMADHLGLDIKDYMRAKIRRETLGEKNPSGYTEIV